MLVCDRRPIFIGMVCWVTMKTTDTALLGEAAAVRPRRRRVRACTPCHGRLLTAANTRPRAGHAGNTTKYLDASALSDLWMSSTGVFIQGGVLGVFCAQAFGVCLPAPSVFFPTLRQRCVLSWLPARRCARRAHSRRPTACAGREQAAREFHPQQGAASPPLFIFCRPPV